MATAEMGNSPPNNSPTVTRWISLSILLLGVVLMAAGSLWYMKNSPGLIKGRQGQQTAQNASQAGGQGASMSSQMEQIEAMIGVLMRRVAENPDDAKSLTILGNLFLDMEEWANAENFLTRAIVAEPAEPAPYYLLALAQVRLEKIDNAEENLIRCIELGGPPEARYSLGVLYSHFYNRPEQAREMFQAVLASPESPADLREAAQRELNEH